MTEKKQTLITMYDDMYTKIDQFSKKGFDDIMNYFFDTYGTFVRMIGDESKAMNAETQQEFYTELSMALSKHVKEMIGSVPAKKMDKVSIPHNMTMAAYLLPLFTYYRIPECNDLAKRMVEVWNDEKTTALTLSLSDYDGIAGGFKKSIFCYITTAVCESRDKADDCYELETLRAYRDQYLLTTEEGRSLVEEYYALAPKLVLAINMQNDPAEIYDRLYENTILPCISDIEEGAYLNCKEKYVDMVRSLQDKFLLS